MSNEFLTKIIGVVVAFVVLAVVLVPICNSLTDGDDSGGNETQTVKYTNPGEEGRWYLLCGDAEYDLYVSQGNQTYLSYEDPSLNPDAYKWPVGVYVAISEEGVVLPYNEGGSMATSPYFQYRTLDWGSNTSVELTSVVHINGSTLTAETRNGDPFVLKNVMLASSSEENADYVSNDNAYSPYVDDRLIIVNYVEYENEDFQGWAWGTINDPVEYIMEASPDYICTTASDGHFNLNEDGTILESLSVYKDGVEFKEYSELQDPDVNWTECFVPAYIYESEGGSNGSTADALISIIPIFVALGLIMGIMGLFYQNRKTI